MSVLYNNIKFLLKKNGIKMAEMEEPYNAGVISKYEKRNAIMKLPLFMIYRIAKNCNVSVEDLITKDLYAENKLAEVRAEIKRLKAKELELQADTQQTETHDLRTGTHACVKQTDCGWK